MSIQISFRDFCKLDSVSFYMSQLRGNKRRNVISKNIVSTQKNYLYRLCNFHYWLIGQEFHYDFIIPISELTFQKYSKTIILEGLEHFLKLYDENTSDHKQDFIQLVIKYLKDPIHVKKKPSTLKIDYYAIKAYFDRNEYPLNFKYNSKTNFTSQGNQTEELLTLNDLLKILTMGQPTIMQKAVFLCKFHRGLDTSTFVDRFNFEAWDQIVEIFGTDQYDLWNLELCPIPIKLTRIKTGVRHTGFLDVDAINTLRNYLNYRRFQMNREMQENEPIFINHFHKPITEDWMRRSFRKLIRNAGLQHLVKNTNNASQQFDFLRILLKSTLIECGTDRDIANHVIGHKGNHFSRQNITFPVETMRLEYAKSSKTINVFVMLAEILNHM